MRRPSVLAVVLVPLFAACGGDDDGGGGGGGDADGSPDGEPDAASSFGACPGPANPIELDGSFISATIEEPGQRDRYRFVADAGTWVLLDITANVESDPERLDSWLRLYGPDGELIVENDDALPRMGRDSEIITRLTADGQHCIEVLDFTDADGDDGTEPVGGNNYTYDLTTVVLDDDVTNVTFDPEDGDALADAADVDLLTSTHILLGELDPEDLDVFKFTIPEADENSTLYSVVLPPGVKGTASTTAARAATVVSVDGEETVALIRPGSAQTDLSPPLRTGEYYLTLSHTGEAGGDNDFYVVKAMRGPENPVDDSEPANDVMGTATALDMMEVGDEQHGFITTFLDDDADTDWFSFEGLDGYTAVVTCGAESSGSGVRDLVVELRDAGEGLTVQMEESPTEPIAITAQLPANGTYYLRLTPGTPAETVASRFVRCGVVMHP